LLAQPLNQTLLGELAMTRWCWVVARRRVPWVVRVMTGCGSVLSVHNPLTAMRVRDTLIAASGLGSHLFGGSEADSILASGNGSGGDGNDTLVALNTQFTDSPWR
jgi:hypothetical protein